MGIQEYFSPFGDIVVGGLAIGTIAMALTWLLDQLLNLFGNDLPDENYPYYQRYIIAIIIIVLAIAGLFGIDALYPETGVVWQILIAILSAMGYRFGRAL